MEMIDIAIMVIKTLMIFGAVITVVPIMLIVERRGCALIQDRPGPNRVGPMGVLQPIADSIKFLFKEEAAPASARRSAQRASSSGVSTSSRMILARSSGFSTAVRSVSRLDGRSSS